MYHTPKQSKALLELIMSLTDIKSFQDVSYSNDTCDSVCIDAYKMQIFFPNVTNPFAQPHDEDQLHFAVSYNDPEKDINGCYLDKEFSVLELIVFLNALDNRFDIDGHTEVSLNEMITNQKEFAQVDEMSFAEFVQPYLDMEEGDSHMFPNELDGQITVTCIKVISHS